MTTLDLGLAESAIERLAGSVTVLGEQMTVRVENIRIAENWRGQRPLAGVVNNFETPARRSGVSLLVIEGVNVGNSRLAQILVRRYGGVYTPQRMIVIHRPL